MEKFDFNDAIKKVKTFSSPKNEQKLSSSNITKNESTDFSFKKNLNNAYEEEKNIISNKNKDNEKEDKSIYSKNDENIFSSGNFGTMENKQFKNHENIFVSNFSIFKDSNNQSKFSSIDNYVYSSSPYDNMDFNFSNKNLINININNNDNINPFSIQLFNNKENKDINQNNEINIEFNNKSNKINNSLNYSKNNHPLNQKINNKINLIKEKGNNKNKTNIKLNENKNVNNKSSNKFIILNNSILQKEKNTLNSEFERISLFQSNIIPIEKKKEIIKNHAFPNLNNYSSIRKVFSDITNKAYGTNRNIEQNKKKFKAKIPKNLEIIKRKVNFTQFEELLKNENNKISKIRRKKGGCICRQFQNHQ